MLRNSLACLAFLAVGINAQSNGTSNSGSCSSELTTNHSAPVVADGYTARLVATNLTSPRGMKFDTEGNLLVVEQEVGIAVLRFEDDGGDCLRMTSKETLVAIDTLNHGIEISSDGNTLYASDSDKLYAWDYSASERRTTSEPTTLVQNMEGTDHTSRTLLLSQSAPGMIVVNRGSFENIDPEARDIESGHSQVKAFNITDSTSPLDFNNDGVLLGWGLRNDVGLAEHPATGGIWAIENSADQLNRSGEDIHQNNPAEELNFLGYLNGTESPNQGQNFGYPDCFSAWDTDEIPDFNGETGQQFATNDQNSTNNDDICGERVAARLVFAAHMAPLDIKFNTEGTQAWIAFHGSWNRDEPIGYQVDVVEFANGEPVDQSDSRTAATTIVSNEDNSACPDACFRPVGLAWDSSGRLFMSSDETGEIYVIVRDEDATGTVNNVTRPAASGSPSSSSPSSFDGAAVAVRGFDGMGVLAAVLCALAFLL